MGLDGTTEETMPVEPIGARFEAFGWEVEELDGHDVEAVRAALDRYRADRPSRPRCLVAHTVKGKGVSWMEGSRTWHLGYLAPTDAAVAMEELNADA
jgi:transketolase